jgi:hypothetical protein
MARFARENIERGGDRLARLAEIAGPIGAETDNDHGPTRPACIDAECVSAVKCTKRADFPFCVIIGGVRR